jgi:hypothetical protein
MAAFGTQQLVDFYVQDLDPLSLRNLVRCCADWRRNGVARHLEDAKGWHLESVDVGHVLLRQAEPALGNAFARNAWRLEAISCDADILSADPYSHHAPGDEVSFRICLSDEPIDGDYRLLDGMHRAIQLARNGERTFQLAVIER